MVLVWGEHQSIIASELIIAIGKYENVCFCWYLLKMF